VLNLLNPKATMLNHLLHHLNPHIHFLLNLLNLRFVNYHRFHLHQHQGLLNHLKHQ
jgi:hypothetical protein